MEHVPWGLRVVHLTGAGREASSPGLNGWASHTLAESPLAVTIREPLGLNAADRTDPVCPLSESASAPLRASQSFAVWSELPVTMREPSGLNAAGTTNPVCPLSVRTSAPLRASQTFAVWSELPVTMREPSRLNAAEAMPSVCPLSVRTRSLSEYCLLKGGFEEYGGPWFPVTRDGEIVA